MNIYIAIIIYLIYNRYQFYRTDNNLKFAQYFVVDCFFFFMLFYIYLFFIILAMLIYLFILLISGVGDII